MLKRLILMALLSLSGMAAEPTLEFIRLSEGVDGGYAPRPVQCQLLIVGRNDGPYDVYYKRRIDGGNSILYQCWRTTSTTTSLDGLEKELEQMGFFGLPQIAPDEQDDIYRQKIGLEIRTSSHRWRHSPPAELSSPPTPSVLANVWPLFRIALLAKAATASSAHREMSMPSSRPCSTSLIILIKSPSWGAPAGSSLKRSSMSGWSIKSSSGP